LRQSNKYLIIKIKNLRESRGWSQRQFSDKTKELFKDQGLSSSYIGMVESGQINPSLKALDKIAKTLNVEKSYLLEEDPSILIEEYKDHLSLKEKEFVAKQENKPWITMASDFEKQGLTPEQVKNLVQLAMKLSEQVKINPNPSK
jgi:transcriptional regulator with XRE-family HTH domain